MEKQKLEKIILVVIIPIFLLGLSYRFIKGRIGAAKTTAGTESDISEQMQDVEIDIEIAEPDGPLQVKYKGSGRDPLKDLVREYIGTRKIHVPKPIKYAKPLPNLNVQGVLWKSERPQAIINGQVLGLGDYVEGVRILKIKREGITVEHGGNPVFIKK